MACAVSLLLATDALFVPCATRRMQRDVLQNTTRVKSGELPFQKQDSRFKNKSSFQKRKQSFQKLEGDREIMGFGLEVCGDSRSAESPGRLARGELGLFNKAGTLATFPDDSHSLQRERQSIEHT